MEPQDRPNFSNHSRPLKRKSSSCTISEKQSTINWFVNFYQKLGRVKRRLKKFPNSLRQFSVRGDGTTWRQAEPRVPVPRAKTSETHSVPSSIRQLELFSMFKDAWHEHYFAQSTVLAGRMTIGIRSRAIFAPDADPPWQSNGLRLLYAPFSTADPLGNDSKDTSVTGATTNSLRIDTMPSEHLLKLFVREEEIAPEKLLSIRSAHSATLKRSIDRVRSNIAI